MSWYRDLSGIVAVGIDEVLCRNTSASFIKLIGAETAAIQTPRQARQYEEQLEHLILINPINGRSAAAAPPAWLAIEAGLTQKKEENRTLLTDFRKSWLPA